jgi:hypothetical protein
MAKMTPISRKTHENMFWQRYTSYQFAQKETLAVLVAAEISRAVHAMPLAFVKQQDTFFLVGILSTIPGQNQFVTPEGRWIGSYVPSCFRSYPFSMARMRENDGMVLCVDEDSGLISESQGEPFFDAEGELARPVKEILNFLTQIQKNRQVTDRSVAALADAGLMKPWAVKESTGDSQTIFKGLYQVDEAGMNQLDDDTFLKLRNALSLPVAYAQLLSMGLAGRLARMADRKAPPPPAGPKDVGGMVLDDDMIRFE